MISEDPDQLALMHRMIWLYNDRHSHKAGFPVAMLNYARFLATWLLTFYGHKGADPNCFLTLGKYHCHRFSEQDRNHMLSFPAVFSSVINSVYAKCVYI